jgi:acetyl-CoA synthetase (ADP-forming)
MAIETTKIKGAEKIVKKVLAAGREILLPDEALDIIKSSGISTPDYALVNTVEEAINTSKAIGFPVVLKIASTDALHKSDINGVAIGIKSELEVEKSYNEIIHNLKKSVPGACISGVLVQKQAPEAAHVIIGGIRDVQFGPAVMFGLGGIFVEVFKDVTFRIAPVTETEALEMVKEIKGYSILSGYRGAKILDIQQLSKAIVTISELISNIDEIQEVELNPLLVYEQGVTAVDARLILKAQELTTG